MLNNETKFEVKIKLRGDGVFDIYANDAWIVSRGHVDNVLAELKTILNDMQSETDNK